MNIIKILNKEIIILLIFMIFTVNILSYGETSVHNSEINQQANNRNSTSSQFHQNNITETIIIYNTTTFSVNSTYTSTIIETNVTNITMTAGCDCLTTTRTITVKNEETTTEISYLSIQLIAWIIPSIILIIFQFSRKKK